MYSLIKNTALFILVVFVLNPIQLNSQTGLIGVKPSLFTLRNSRLTVGLIGSTNITSDDSQMPLFQVFNGDLPNGEDEFDFESITLPYSSIGLSLDLFSPNSRIGLSISAEYNTSEFSIISASEKFTFKSNSVIFPFYLKYRFGDIHGSKFIIGRGNFFSSLGPYVSIPINFTRTTAGAVDKLSEVQQVGYGASAIFGIVLRLGKGEAKDLSKDVRDIIKSKHDLEINNYTESLRLWIFLRADHTLTDLFNNNFSSQIIPNSSDPFYYKVTNITLGAALFFGGKLSRLE